MLQLYVAVEPKDVPSSSTIPFGGLLSGPQSMAGGEREGGGRGRREGGEGGRVGGEGGVEEEWGGERETSRQRGKRAEGWERVSERLRALIPTRQSRT